MKKNMHVIMMFHGEPKPWAPSIRRVEMKGVNEDHIMAVIEAQLGVDSDVSDWFDREDLGHNAWGYKYCGKDELLVSIKQIN